MELSKLKGVGPARLAYLRAVGISSLRDLLYYLPLRYEDRTTPQPVVTLTEGPAMVQGIISEKPKIAYFRGISRVSALLRDGYAVLPLCWFNEPWMVQQMPVGQTIMLYGRVQTKNGRRQMQNPQIVTEPGWMPVYHAVKGIPARAFRSLMKEALCTVWETCPETLPRSFRDRHSLCELQTALRQAHFPDSLDDLKSARRRLSFESMLMYLMGVAMHRNHPQPGLPMAFSIEETERFWERMPFSPTGAQKRVLQEIARDLQQEKAMSRLVQGDVGCGKTALAFGAIYLAWKAGFQTAMMTPTEILAQQHYINAKQMLEPLGIQCRLLTGSTRAKERRDILLSLKNGDCSAVFGTHALISENVEYQRLGLVITDEQHRFGVRQRSRLQEKGILEDQKAPHVLVMSATPIPRTLALILYGDLDLSIVDELPPGRQPVKTRLVPDEKRNDMYRFLREKVSMGQQAYIVCPLVEESEEMDDVKSAKTLFSDLTENELKDLKVGLTWGQQKSEEKAKVLQAFTTGEIQVLISTSVIEVGVNVPNATVMIIENAERFGLSQLHQLRGRVGRGSVESWCFLLSDASRKLRVLCETNDGFAVAQKDLELRGPGDLMGTRQSGEALHGFLLDGDTRLLDEVLHAVRELESSPEYENERGRIEDLTRNYFQGKEFSIALN